MDRVFRPYNMDVQKYALFWKEPCQILESLILQQFSMFCCCQDTWCQKCITPCHFGVC